MHGVPLCSYVEDIITKAISTNADKGRMAMESVINKLNTEMQGISKTMDELKAHVRRSIQEHASIEDIEIPQLNFSNSKS